MFTLINGKPIFYIGKINGIGYKNKEEKEEIINQLKEDNPDIEIKDEKVDIDKELKNKAELLGKLNLTYSKSEFMKYLNGTKPCPLLLSIENEQAIMELANILGGML